LRDRCRWPGGWYFGSQGRCLRNCYCWGRRSRGRVEKVGGKCAINLVAQVEDRQVLVADLVRDEWPCISTLHQIEGSVAALDDSRLSWLGDDRISQHRGHGEHAEQSNTAK
jgi:hypothetical protein